MKPEDFPLEIQSHLIPKPGGELMYQCLGCRETFGIEQLLYTCPSCGHVLLIFDRDFSRLTRTPGAVWRKVFDYRKMLTIPALKGIFRFHEFLAPVIPLEAVVWLGEGGTSLVMANDSLRDRIGADFYFKNDGQNPSASFKDRGMACAMSYINHLIQQGKISNVLAVCASTGDTSAAAALYAAYLHPKVKSAVLLPKGRVTPQQLSQPLGSGAKVFEIPGVFDDCMKVVEALSSRYNVALLNSKNAWRILGQESFSFEIAQDFEYDMQNKAVFVPIGNAGNITAVMSGFLKLHSAQIITSLPKIVGVQSEHADPVFRYYLEEDPEKRRFDPVAVTDSVAQAAMIGNPVSMPRVVELARLYDQTAGKRKVFVVRVAEQAIMDHQLMANRNGHIACTQGGESLAGLARALKQGIVDPAETAVLDATAHALKFTDFQNLYFENRFDPAYGITANPELVNKPDLVQPQGVDRYPQPGNPLSGPDLSLFVDGCAEDIAQRLDLSPRS